MTTMLTETQPARLHTGDVDGRRCTVCDRPWPGEPTPLQHRWMLSDTEPRAECICNSTHTEPTWHQFEVLNSSWAVVAAGMVCPTCAVDPGLDAAVVTATVMAIVADQNAN